MSRYIVAPACPAHTETVLAMITRLSAFHAETAIITRERLTTQLFGSGPAAYAFVAWDGATAVGYAALTSHIRIHSDQPRFDIQHLFVEEKARNQGIGRALIVAARDFARAKSSEGLTINCAPSNTAAAAAYRAMGLEQITGRHPRFWVSV